MPEGIRGRPFEMSRFHCREMLYDYMTGRLDPQRKAAVEAVLKTDKDLKSELDEYIDAAHYCERLSQVTLSEATISDLENIRLQSEVVVDKIRYRNWPDLLKWSSEAVVISVFVAGLAMVIPWSTIRSVFKNPPHNEVVLADIEKTPDTSSATIEALPAGANIKPAPPVEKIAAPNVAAAPTVPTAAAPPAVQAPAPAPPPATVAVPAVTASIVAATPVQPAIPIAPAVPVPTSPAPTKSRLAEAVAPEAAKPATEGMLYRIMMNKDNIEALAPQLRDRIVALGGKKAGEVEIGWRQPGQNYFHFSIPEENYQKLLSILGEMGQTRIYKSPHARVMPEGIMRIILTIKDGEANKPIETIPESVPAEAVPSEESTPEKEE